MLLHGWGGSPYPHWQSYIASEIAKDYGCVNFVRFPDMDNPSLSKWLDTALLEIKYFHPDIIICHSLANTLWFHLCNEGLIPYCVEHLFLVAPPSLQCNIEELNSFFPVNIPKQLYAKNAKLIISDNDPYMDLDEAKELQKSLHVDMQILHNAGHINADSGFGEWKSFLEEIRSCQNS
ncbi:MAG: serine hydrolase family protein [Epsilonproteobacteria bacterium]|nr:serine hydrolase family protein [Campylobacterota bacterium]